MKPLTKRAIARQIMLQNKNLSLIETLAEMRKRKATTTAKHLSFIRYELRKEGHDLPNWSELSRQSKGTHIKLGTKSPAVMKAIYNNSRASLKEIRELLDKKGVKARIDYISSVRSKMRRWFGNELDFSRKPKLIQLTAGQQAMIPKFQSIIKKALYGTIYPSLNWPSERHKECDEFVNGQILQLIENYDKTRSNVSTYIYKKTRFLVKEFIRQNIAANLGISLTEAKLLVRIIREKSQGLKDNTEIAKKVGCSQTEVTALWRAYQDYLRISGRTGKKEE